MRDMKLKLVSKKLLFLCVVLAVLPVAKAGTGARTASDGACRSIRRPHEVVPGFVFVEAEDFEDYGRWRLDTQFVHKMGSAYLIAPGVGSPIGPARTTVDLPRAGRWRTWVRTKDWLPAFSPGRFALSVGGRRSRELGASKREGWSWELAAEFDLEAGSHQLSLDDLSGAFARCDAVLLTTDLSYRPPDEVERLAAERDRLLGRPDKCFGRGSYDVLVVGAGPAGVTAAVAAARGGVRVALVGDRPVLGGNASDEIGVNMCGAAESHAAARETGLAEEAVCLRTRHPGPGMSNSYSALAAGETNLTVFCNERMVAACASDGRVRTVTCRNTLTGARSVLSARLFVDATGDGWLGYFAGADYREGREGQAEFGELCAPERPDKLTMSGLLHEPGVGVCYRYEETEGSVDYRTPVWARVLPAGFSRPVRNLRGQWWIEHAGTIDDCAEPERARDELIRISFAYWGWLKNDSPHREKARNCRLAEIPILAGRRESRRLMGDVVLTANDCLQGRVFDDAVAYGGWPLDTHDPRGMTAAQSDGYWVHHPDVPLYTIPYRCLYSRNVANLFMAGRDISASHMALGSTRVQQTCAVIGQAVGTAAALCLRHAVGPRELGQTRIRELQQILLKDDAYIPGFRNADARDFARRARVTASSACGSFVRHAPNARGFARPADVVYTNASPSAVVDGVSRAEGNEAHAWASEAGLPQWLRLDFPEAVLAREVRVTFDTNLELRAKPRPSDPVLVKAYSIEGSEDGKTWLPLAAEADNFRRLRVHRFSPLHLKSVRLTVRETHGARHAFVSEVRVY